MERSEKIQTGTLKVSESVIATIVRLATLEIEGVDSLASSNASIKGLISKTNQTGAIRIKLVGDVVEISLRVIVKYGHKIVNVAEQIQNSVKSSVQTMTGVAVARVNVQIAGVVFEDTKKI
jgi:uncharacterized alkaline shock family protein YloU